MTNISTVNKQGFSSLTTIENKRSLFVAKFDVTNMLLFSCGGHPIKPMVISVAKVLSCYSAMIIEKYRISRGRLKDISINEGHI